MTIPNIAIYAVLNLVKRFQGTSYVTIDANSLIALAKTAPVVSTKTDPPAYGDTGSLGLLGLANRRIVVTEAVYLEAVNSTSADAGRVAQWFAAATNAGILDYETSGPTNLQARNLALTGNFTGGLQLGEQSILELSAPGGRYAGKSITVISDDGPSFFPWVPNSNPGIRAPISIPGFVESQPISTVQYINSLLLGGAITPAEYFDIKQRIEPSQSQLGLLLAPWFSENVPVQVGPIVSGQPLVEVTLSSQGVSTFRLLSGGGSMSIGPNDRIAIDAAGGGAVGVFRNNPAIVQRRCFVAGTPVLTLDGRELPIEQVQPGSWVMSFDQFKSQGTGELHPARVVRTFSLPGQRIWRLGSAQVGVTPGHAYIDGEDGQDRPLWQIVVRGGSLIDAGGRRQRVKFRNNYIQTDVVRPLNFLRSDASTELDGAVGIRGNLALAIPVSADELPVVWVEDRGETETVYNFEVEGLHTYVAGGWRVHNDSVEANQLGSSLGSFIGGTLLDIWGVDNIAVRLGVGAVTSSLGGWIGESIYHGLNGEAISSPMSLFSNIGGSLITSAVNMGGAALGRALVGAIGLQSDPLANGLASIFGGALAQRGAIEIVKAIGGTDGLRLLADWSIFGVKYATETVSLADGSLVTRIKLDGAGNPIVDVGSLAGSLVNAAAGFIGSFAGGKLAAALFGESPGTSIGSSIGGTIGTIIGGLTSVTNFFVGLGLGAAAGPVGIFIGAFVGAFLGGALGGVLGGSQSTWGETDVVVQNGTLQLGVSRGNGKALQTASQLAGGAALFESNILGAIGGRLVGSQTLTFGMTESTKTIYGRVGGFQVQGDADEVLERAAMAHLKTVRIAGGDLMSKQALRNTDADTRAQMGDDLTIAASYALYVDNTVLFEQNLDELMANRGGAAAWAAQKARAEGQLNLDGAFTAAAYRADSQVPLWNIGATTALASIDRPADLPPTPAALGTATMAFSASLVVLDLNRDGVIALGVGESGALFDIDGDGFREQTGWLTPFDGFLVFDENNNGQIDSVGEMVVSQQWNGLGIALSSLDRVENGGDGDGYFDADDGRFFAARVWTDRNLNGFVDLGELWSLTRFNIDHLSLTGVAVSDGEEDHRDSAGNKIAWEGAYGINGAHDDFGYMTTLSLAYDTKGVKMVQDPNRPGWFLLEHENGEKTAFGLGTSALNLVGGGHVRAYAVRRRSRRHSHGAWRRERRGRRARHLHRRQGRRRRHHGRRSG